MAKLKRGDVVEYHAAHIPGMIQWAWLDGRIGVVESGPYDTDWGDREGYSVRWIFLITEESESDPERAYDTQLLRKIGEIELPPKATDV